MGEGSHVDDPQDTDPDVDATDTQFVLEDPADAKPRKRGKKRASKLDHAEDGALESSAKPAKRRKQHRQRSEASQETDSDEDQIERSAHTSAKQPTGRQLARISSHSPAWPQQAHSHAQPTAPSITSLAACASSHPQPLPTPTFSSVSVSASAPSAPAPAHPPPRDREGFAIPRPPSKRPALTNPSPSQPVARKSKWAAYLDEPEPEVAEDHGDQAEFGFGDDSEQQEVISD